MYDYVVDELPALVAANLPIDGERAGIFGHSMGGHGALTIALKNPRSLSLGLRLCADLLAAELPLGRKSAGQLSRGRSRQPGNNTTPPNWCEAREQHLPVLVDQGDADNFLAAQLKTELLEKACAEASYPMTIRMQAGYDHSYFFIASFIGEHIEFHSSICE